MRCGSGAVSAGIEMIDTSCRICWGSFPASSTAAFSPCKCRGTLSFVSDVFVVVVIVKNVLLMDAFCSA
jgi:hypothetical protein